jgi:hypothetical protein
LRQQQQGRQQQCDCSFHLGVHGSPASPELSPSVTWPPFRASSDTWRSPC